MGTSRVILGQELPWITLPQLLSEFIPPHPFCAIRYLPVHRRWLDQWKYLPSIRMLCVRSLMRHSLIRLMMAKLHLTYSKVQVFKHPCGETPGFLLQSKFNAQEGSFSSFECHHGLHGRLIK